MKVVLDQRLKQWDGETDMVNSVRKACEECGRPQEVEYLTLRMILLMALSQSQPGLSSGEKAKDMFLRYELGSRVARRDEIEFTTSELQMLRDSIVAQSNAPAVVAQAIHMIDPTAAAEYKVDLDNEEDGGNK